MGYIVDCNNCRLRIAESGPEPNIRDYETREEYEDATSSFWDEWLEEVAEVGRYCTACRAEGYCDSVSRQEK
jgi:hypothetical protein